MFQLACPYVVSSPTLNTLFGGFGNETSPYGAFWSSVLTGQAKGHKYCLMTTPLILNVVIVNIFRMCYHCQYTSQSNLSGGVLWKRPSENPVLVHKYFIVRKSVDQTRSGSETHSSCPILLHKVNTVLHTLRLVSCPHLTWNGVWT